MTPCPSPTGCRALCCLCLLSCALPGCAAPPTQMAGEMALPISDRVAGRFVYTVVFHG